IHAEYDPQRTYLMSQNGASHTVNGDGWSAGVSVSQQLFDFSRSSHAIRSAKIRHEISRLSLEEAKALMRYEVRVAYALLLVQKAALKARGKDLVAKKALYKQAKALVRQGLKTRADESRFLSSVRQAEDALALAQASYDKARITLEQYIGEAIPKGTRFEDWRLENAAKSSTKADPKQILANNLQVRIAQRNQEAFYEEFRATQLQRFGTVDLVAEADRYDTLSRYDNTIVGVRYSAPIYSGGRLSAQTQQNRIAEMVAAAQKDSQKRAVTQEARSILADLKETRKRIAARLSQLRSADETRALIQARYEQGLATYMEVLDAEAVWLDAKLGLLSAYYTRLERQSRLEYLDAK
ncbi:TolC family protein, partial [Nitratifractor sp.]|uniref:TolC family protein n=1 Tax=Nitratifractor sp. TaxID=2268144 RepID=UPI0025D52E8B